MEVVIKLFLMRLAYAAPEIVIEAESCFSKEEQEFLDQQIISLEGKTEKQKNPYKAKDLKRYVWAIARLGGWKGYESKRHPGITTLWIGIKYFGLVRSIISFCSSLPAWPETCKAPSSNPREPSLITRAPSRNNRGSAAPFAPTCRWRARGRAPCASVC